MFDAQNMIKQVTVSHVKTGYITNGIQNHLKPIQMHWSNPTSARFFQSSDPIPIRFRPFTSSLACAQRHMALRLASVRTCALCFSWKLGYLGAGLKMVECRGCTWIPTVIYYVYIYIYIVYNIYIYIYIYCILICIYTYIIYNYIIYIRIIYNYIIHR